MKWHRRQYIRTAQLIVHAEVSRFCQVGAQFSGMVAPARCGMLQVCKVLQAAVVVTTRWSWHAVGSLVRVGHRVGPWAPRELEEVLTNVAVLVMVLGLSFWAVMRSQGEKPESMDPPESSLEADELGTGSTVSNQSVAFDKPDGSLYTAQDQGRAAV